MSLRTATLVIFDLHRLVRHRGLAASLMILPLAAGVAQALFPGSHVTLACAWGCPVVCALVTASVVFAHRLMDRASGLDEAIRSCPVSGKAVYASSVVAWMVVFVLQMAVLGGIIALR